MLSSVTINCNVTKMVMTHESKNVFSYPSISYLSVVWACCVAHHRRALWNFFFQSHILRQERQFFRYARYYNDIPIWCNKLQYFHNICQVHIEPKCSKILFPERVCWHFRDKIVYLRDFFRKTPYLRVFLHRNAMPPCLPRYKMPNGHCPPLFKVLPSRNQFFSIPPNNEQLPGTTCQQSSQHSQFLKLILFIQFGQKVQALSKCSLLHWTFNILSLHSLQAGFVTNTLCPMQGGHWCSEDYRLPFFSHHIVD